MKKYWKLLTTLLIIVVVIGTFYIRTVVATDLPQFFIKSEHGNDEEIEALVITGEYMKDYDHLRVWIDQKGSDYWHERSVFGQVNGQYLPISIQELQKEYWNFTRGKGERPTYYDDGQQFLAYANITYDRSHTAYNKYKFNISILNKETNKKHSIQLPLPNARSYSFVRLNGLYVVEDTLKVVTLNDRSDGQWSEFHLYTFDIGEEKLVEGEVIGSYTNDKQMSMLQENSLQSESDYIIFINGDQDSAEQVEPESEETTIEKEITNGELMVYHLKSQSVETHELPWQGHDKLLLAKNKIYSLSTEDSGLKISSYDLDKKTTNAYSVPLQAMSDQTNYLAQIYEGNLYVVTQYAVDGMLQSIYKIDLESGELVYEGRIESDQSNLNDTANLYVRNIQFK